MASSPKLPKKRKACEVGKNEDGEQQKDENSSGSEIAHIEWHPIVVDWSVDHYVQPTDKSGDQSHGAEKLEKGFAFSKIKHGDDEKYETDRHQERRSLSDQRLGMFTHFVLLLYSLLKVEHASPFKVK